jgi:hypothetical protein
MPKKVVQVNPRMLLMCEFIQMVEQEQWDKLSRLA